MSQIYRVQVYANDKFGSETYIDTVAVIAPLEKDAVKKLTDAKHYTQYEKIGLKMRMEAKLFVP